MANREERNFMDDWQNEETRLVMEFRELLNKYCHGDKEAISLCEDFVYVAHIWDDLYDRDKDRSREDINAAFTKALSYIPRNRYYQENVREFAALTLIATTTWRIANEFESGNDDEKLGSFILRDNLLQIVYFIILLSNARHGKNIWDIEEGKEFFKEIFKGYHRKYLEFINEVGGNKK